MNKEKILKAGQIAKQVKEYIRPLVKKNMSLLELAEKIESKIEELGGKCAFPCNLSIDNIAAHFTPSHDDKTLATGLLKVDFGVHVDGWVADNAFSIDLENNEENKKLIEASKKALDAASKIIKTKIFTSKIGEIVEKTIESYSFTPVINLSGHEIDHYDLHAGLTIPNTKNAKEVLVKEGLYAVEPFASTGTGKVHDGKPSTIYQLQDERNVRSPIAREILDHIIEEYQTLPFCSRWLVKKFGTKALFGLKQLEENGNLHQYPQLVEKPGVKISQAENTFLVEKDKVTVTSE